MTTKSKGPASDGPAAETHHETNHSEPDHTEPKPKKIGGIPPNIANQFSSKGGKKLNQIKGGSRNFRHQGR
jgi:hypothetical protein